MITWNTYDTHKGVCPICGWYADLVRVEDKSAQAEDYDDFLYVCWGCLTKIHNLHAKKHKRLVYKK